MSGTLHGLEGPYAVPGKMRMFKGRETVWHDVKPNEPSKTYCGVVVGLGYHYADEPLEGARRCGTCARIKGGEAQG